MKELLMHTEYTGQEIINWIIANPKHEIAMELTRKYYEFDNEWFDTKCNINPERKYTIHSYTTTWYDNWANYSRLTYKMERVPIVQPRRSSLRRGVKI
jgi:hypothetical protein